MARLADDYKCSLSAVASEHGVIGGRHTTLAQTATSRSGPHRVYCAYEAAAGGSRTGVRSETSPHRSTTTAAGQRRAETETTPDTKRVAHQQVVAAAAPAQVVGPKAGPVLAADRGSSDGRMVEGDL